MHTQTNDTGRIAVVTGGSSTERERSLLSGNTVLESLTRQGYTTVFLDASGPRFVDQVRTADVAFLAIAGQHAEDGKLQGLLEYLGIPYTGSGVTASALGMHKTMAKTVVAAAGVAVLPQADIPTGAPADAVAKALAEKLAFPLIVKPQSEGGSIGMTVCHEVAELVDVIAELDRAGTWFVEPFVPGTPATCAVIETGVTAPSRCLCWRPFRPAPSFTTTPPSATRPSISTGARPRGPKRPPTRYPLPRSPHTRPSAAPGTPAPTSSSPTTAG